MTPIDYIILVLAVAGLLGCIAGYASTFLPPRKRPSEGKTNGEVTK